MKERGIIFDAESMRANLAGRKTMTRRVMKPQPPPRWGGVSEIAAMLGHCPYGQPGDRIWAKETFWTPGEIPNPPLVDTGDYIKSPNGWAAVFYRATMKVQDGRWTSPLFMPRWASRFVAEIVDVRVERLQDISEADAIAEGINLEDGECKCGEPMRGHRYDGDYHTPVPMFSARELYRDRWDVINAKRGHGWDANDWVWVVTYQEERR